MPAFCKHGFQAVGSDEMAGAGARSLWPAPSCASSAVSKARIAPLPLSTAPAAFPVEKHVFQVAGMAARPPDRAVFTSTIEVCPGPSSPDLSHTLLRHEGGLSLGGEHLVEQGGEIAPQIDFACSSEQCAIAIEKHVLRKALVAVPLRDSLPLTFAV